MAKAYVSMGSNIEPEKNIRAALKLMASRLKVRAVSTVYRTEPVGMPGQAVFYNCVAEVETEKAPEDLKFSVLRSIEDALGRHRSGGRNGPRTIDLDLIIYDGLKIKKEGLAVPDPDIATRAFLAVPLSELAPELEVPGTGLKASDMASVLDAGTMEALGDYTCDLKKLISG